MTSAKFDTLCMRLQFQGFVASTVHAAKVVQTTATAACYGASCNNLDPTGRCTSDAKTVASMAIIDEGNPVGQLDLRWSRACQANWGRFTAYPLSFLNAIRPPYISGVKITSWNPGQSSYGTAPGSDSSNNTWWSMMTSGIPRACTGVQISYTSGTLNEHEAVDADADQGEWHWGPCY
jgi:hypothetical protein